ncbi:FAD-dependent oxidoreductase [Kibdelosporangium phytohabitans]|uniref:FAD-binding monooxygenase n=1 Tax=Kibdelosporangium phytohabitans TaxID=860235 RepID=A0A0N9I804_9PSEU|nr:FAD-dependent oxidoreductase [Kibdelosporangium phytohabitans]ALG10758.1 FAD-binding monooxygenase [Kibdelosporangium phytohabitans]MBE1461911.1 2-polyprenyl-6-methoxyphenol hydroxylase-like FAD-dependent oxidoreductase [Kibdelosporangium phytohabitans]
MSTRAVVLGGSMAGLLAARVLAETFTEVLVVDRDKLLGVAEPRRGVPQGKHIHGLLARGHQILDELFDGFTQDALAEGALTGDLGEHRWFFAGREAAKAVTGMKYISATRPVLESFVRARVASLGNVKFLEQHDIVGLAATPDKSRITGARVHSGSEATLDADLVVDATGRGSRTPAWLAELGYARPAEEQVKIDFSYTTRIYRLPDPSVMNGVKSVNPLPSPLTRRSAFFSAMENGKWVLSVGGVLGDRAPTDPDGFLDYVRSLPTRDIYEVVKDAEPITEAVNFRYPVSIRPRYDKLTRMPAGFIVLGDAACSFNPVYGQGMTVAAQEALVLREHVRRGVPDPLEFQRAIAKVIDVPWGISAGGDLSFPEVEGKRPLQVRVLNGYMAKVMAAATKDPVVLSAFMRVAGLVDPPQALLKPPMLLRVLRQAR